MKETLSSTLVTFLRFWGIAIAVLFLPYLGLYILGLKPIELLQFLAGTVVLGLVFALLLTLDKQTVPTFEHVEQFTLWALFHELVVRRKSLLTLFILASVGIVIGTYYVCVSLFSIEYTGDSGVMIRLPGHTVYYIPISPYGASEAVGGWENTHIPLEKGEIFTLEISGSVSPGFLQGLDLLQRHMRELIEWEMNKRKGPRPAPPNYPKWHFTGPEGYRADLYSGKSDNKTSPEKIPDFKSDEGITVKGKPHNSVIGFIRQPSSDLPNER